MPALRCRAIQKFNGKSNGITRELRRCPPLSSDRIKSFARRAYADDIRFFYSDLSCPAPPSPLFFHQYTAVHPSKFVSFKSARNSIFDSCRFITDAIDTRPFAKIGRAVFAVNQTVITANTKSRNVRGIFKVIATTSLDAWLLKLCLLRMNGRKI